MSSYRDLRFGTEHSLLELKIEIFAKVGTPLRARATTAPAASK
jgi:hypothetical protein